METLWHPGKVNEVFNFNAIDWGLFFQLNATDRQHSLGLDLRNLDILFFLTH